MNDLRFRAGVTALVATSALALTPAAQAAPPPNDDRADARVIQVPSETSGTTVDSTIERDEPFAGCATARGSVWYRFTTPVAGRIAVSLQASGDLDASISVLRLVRSQTTQVDCDDTDTDGAASVPLRAEAGATYLIRVSQRSNSVSGTFTVQLDPTQSEASPPGRRLPANGATGTVNRVFNPSDAFFTTLRAGRTYRANLFTTGCVAVQLFGPNPTTFETGTRDIGAGSCGGYFTFTPGAGETGRYSFEVSTVTRDNKTQPYRLSVGVAGPDDTTPGIFIRNYANVRGTLNGRRLDGLDLYRFDVTRTSDLDLTVAAADEKLGLSLLNDSGRLLGSGDQDGRRLRPGRYYAAVEANGGAGRYTLRRVSRTITRSTISFGGRSRRQIGPGRATSINVSVRPGASGPVTITVERLDPLTGFQFLRRVRVPASGGRASYAFLPPSVGRYRATAEFGGSREFAPSSTGTARLLVAAPLIQ